MHKATSTGSAVVLSYTALTLILLHKYGSPHFLVLQTDRRTQSVYDMLLKAVLVKEPKPQHTCCLCQAYNLCKHCRMIQAVWREQQHKGVVVCDRMHCKWSRAAFMRTREADQGCVYTARNSSLFAIRRPASIRVRSKSMLEVWQAIMIVAHVKLL